MCLFLCLDLTDPIGPFAGLVKNRLGSRATVFISSVIICVGMIGASLSQNVTQLILTYGVITGTNSCFPSSLPILFWLVSFTLCVLLNALRFSTGLTRCVGSEKELLNMTTRLTFRSVRVVSHTSLVSSAVRYPPACLISSIFQTTPFHFISLTSVT